MEHSLALRCLGEKQFHLKNINCVFKFCLLYFEPHIEILICQCFPHVSEMSSLTHKTLKPYGPELMSSVGTTGMNCHDRRSIFHDILEYCFIILVELMYIVFVPFDWTRALFLIRS